MNSARPPHSQVSEPAAPPETAQEVGAGEEDKRRSEREVDWQLVQRAQGGEYGAFEELVARHSGKTYALALGMLRIPQDAEEVVQDTFLNAFQKLDTFRGESAFTSWLYRIAANNALMRLRKKKRDPTESIEHLTPSFREDGRHAEQPLTWSRTAEELVSDRQLAGALEEALSRLPPQYRVVLLMRDVDGLSNEEISDILGVTVPAVKSRLHRARLAVRQQLEHFHHRS